MRIFARFVLIALVAISSFAFLSDSPAEAGASNSFFTSVTFSCPNIIDFAGQWESGDFEDAYIRAWDPATDNLLDEALFNATILGLNTYSGSFVLAQPLPDNIVVEMWVGFPAQPVGPTSDAQINKPFGLAELFNPPNADLDAGVAGGPPLPLGQWWLVDSTTILVPTCTTVGGCQLAFPVYGTALVLDQQLGYSEPNGEPARDVQGNLIWVLHDVDQDGADTYLIVDIQAGADGETWLGIFIGSCDPVYVPLNMVYPLNAIPVD